MDAFALCTQRAHCKAHGTLTFYGSALCLRELTLCEENVGQFIQRMCPPVAIRLRGHPLKNRLRCPLELREFALAPLKDGDIHEGRAGTRVSFSCPRLQDPVGMLKTQLTANAGRCCDRQSMR